MSSNPTPYERVKALPPWLRKELNYLAFMNPSKDNPTFHHNIAVSGERILSELDKARNYLAHFSYEDWESGNDDRLRVGDRINLNHQRGHDGAETNVYGKIVCHPDNCVPVVLPDKEWGEEFICLQVAFMDGFTFTRLAQLKDTDKKGDE